MKSTAPTTIRLRRALSSLVVLAVLAVALQSLVFSGASFSATTNNAGNSFEAGSVSHVNSKSSQFVLDAAGLRPGRSQTGTLTITGGGNFSARYTISRISLSDVPASPPPSGVLQLTIDDMTTGVAVQEWTGVAGAFTSVTIDTIAPGATRTYRFTLAFPTASAVAALQGATMTLRLGFTGVQQ